MTITFGSYTFEERGHIDAWEPPYRAAVYVILMPDATATPRPFREIYFGESANLSQRGFPSHHAWENGASLITRRMRTKSSSSDSSVLGPRLGNAITTPSPSRTAAPSRA